MASNSKKAAPADIKNTAAAAAEVKAEAPKTEKADVKKAAAPKTEKKKETPKAAKTTKTAKKPAAKKEAAPAAKKESAPAAKKETAPKTEKKPAAKKAAAPKAAAKPKTAAKKTAEKPAAKRGGRKKSVSYDSVFEAGKKKILAADITKIKYPIAVNVELDGAAEGDFYIYINAEEQSIAVEPYKYNDHDVSIRADAEGLLAVFTGKKNVYDALADGDIKIYGETKKAILLIHAAF